MRKLLLFCLLIFVVGCTPITVNLYDDNLSHAPTNPKNVKVFKTEPEADYIKLGEITVDRAKDWRRAEKVLKREASKIGADAVLVIDTQISQRGGMVPSSSGSGPLGFLAKEIIVTGIAIKYKK